MSNPEIREQVEQKKESLPNILKQNFSISHASEDDIKNIIRDRNSKVYHIQIKIQPDENWTKPADYIESINQEYLEKFKNERLKKKIWKKEISEDKKKKLEEKREKWWNYFEKHKERREDRETEMMNKYQKLWEKKKESEIKKMKLIRYRWIEKYKKYPAIYNTLVEIVDHSRNIENIDLLIMENTPEYEREEKIKSMRAALRDILSEEWNIEEIKEEIKQGRNDTIKSIKKDVLCVFSKIQKQWNTVIDGLWNNDESIEEKIQVIEKIMDFIPQKITFNKTNGVDRIKYIYRREWNSWYKYDQTVEFLKTRFKKIIEC